MFRGELIVFERVFQKNMSLANYGKHAVDFFVNRTESQKPLRNFFFQADRNPQSSLKRKIQCSTETS